MSDVKNTIAKNITRLRLAAGMTQKELAAKLTYSDKAVSKWERAESTPDITTLTAIAELFDVSLDLLVRDIEPAASASSTPAEEPASKPLAPLPPEEDGVAQKQRDIQHGVIALIVILLVWAAAGVVFLLFYSIAPFLQHYWLCFVYAVPVSLILYLIFNSMWFIPRRNYAIMSALVWSVLMTVHIHFMCYGMSPWQVYLAGIPAQVAILLCRKLLSEKP